ncbi:hypothetical protein EV122DRAFT_290035 [Schizophyllum commune]
MSSSKPAPIPGAVEEDGNEPPLPQTPKRGRPSNDPALARTPTRMTKERPPAIKKKIDALIGTRACLLTGLRHKFNLNTAHWLRRELALCHPEVFNRLQDKIGTIIQLHDGRIVRSLRLDSSDNQDNLSPDPHASFDGFVLGSGQWCLIPLSLDECLERIAKNPHMSARQWFPERTWLYRVHVFADEVPLTLTRRGPVIRTYDKYMSPEQLASDAAVLAAEGCEPIFTIPSTNPDDVETLWRVEAANKQREDGKSWILRSHLNRANVLVDAVIKLRYRWMEAKAGRMKPLFGLDSVYYRKIWPVLQYCFQDVPSLCPAELIAMPVPDEVLNARQSQAFLRPQTEPAIPPTPKAPVKPRPVAGSAPPVRVPSSGFLAKLDSPPPSPSPLRPLSPTLPMPPPPESTQGPRGSALKRKRSVKDIPTVYSKPSRGDTPSELDAGLEHSKKKKRKLADD